MKRKITIGSPARPCNKCLASTHPLLPFPPRQLPDVLLVLPDQPERLVVNEARYVIEEVLYQFELRQLVSLLMPIVTQVAPLSIEYCKDAPSNCCSVSQNTFKVI